MRYNDEEKAVILGALLHDIGKINYLKYGGSKSHEESAIEILDCMSLGNLREKVEEFVSTHHSENTIIKKADRLSASERQDRDETEGETSSRSFEPMKSVFTIIAKDDSAEEAYYYPLVSVDSYFSYIDSALSLLSEGKDFGFSYEKGLAIKNTYMQPRTHLDRAYEKLEENLCKELKNIDFSNFDLALVTLDALLKNYLFFVPSATYVSTPDISLYHHLKSTAAIALCLKRSPNKVIWIEGDVSGIQNFITYSFKGAGGDKMAAKRLRARSIYVNLLVDATIRYLRNKLNLPVFNVFMKSGGRFLIVAPYSEENIKKLEEAKRAVNDFLYKNFGTILFVSIAWVVKGFESFEPKHFQSTLIELSEKTEEEKSRKFWHQFERFKKSDYETMQGILAESEVCPVCGRNKKQQESAEEGTDALCENCSSFVIFGGKFVKNNILSVFYNKDVDAPSSLIFDFGDFSVGYAVESRTLKGADECILINEADFIGRKAHSFEFYARYTPQKSFEEMVALPKTVESKRSRELAKLAVFKADVDNLGALFSFGLKEDSYSFSRVSTLSALLDMFFSVVVDKLAERNDCYVVFSGGDDLIVVGRFDKIINFALLLNKAFSAWTCNNAEIHISGGIAMASHKFPIRKLIECADEQLESSKDPTHGKNKITLFDNMLGWNSLDECLSFCRELLNYKKDGKLSMSMIYQLLWIKNRCLLSDDVNVRANAEFILHPEPYVKYFVARNWSGEKEHMPLLVEKIIKHFQNKGEEIEVIVSLCSLLNRYDLEVI